MRRTGALIQVLQVIAPGERLWGYEISRRTGLRSGVLYPILARLVQAGWLTADWEDPTSPRSGPLRRYYVLTDRGVSAVASVLSSAQEDPRFRHLFYPG